MTCNIVAVKEVLTDSLKRAEKLNETMDKTSEGEYLPNTIEVNKKALSLLDNRDFDELFSLADSDLDSSEAMTLLTKSVGGVISATVGANPENADNLEQYVLKSAKHVNNKKHGDMLEVTVADIKGEQASYMFKRGSAYSIPNASGNVMLAPGIDVPVDVAISNLTGISSVEIAESAKATSSAFKAAQAILDTAKSTEELLKNSASLDEDAFNYDRASQVKNYKHGSVTDMQNMLADLHAIGGRPITDEQYDYYNDLLGGMHEHFFHDMNLFIDNDKDDAQGWVALDKKHILLNTTTNTDVGMSNAEVFMHETIHTMTTWALGSDSPKAKDLQRRLNYLRDKAFKRITWKDLMRTDDTLSEKGARERHDYIFKSKNADDEFLAFAMTNPGMMELLGNIHLKDERKGGMFNVIKNFFADLINAVMGNYKFSNRNSTMTAEIRALVAALAEINNKVETELSVGASALAQASDIVARAEGSFEEGMSEIASKLFDTKGKVAKLPEDPNFVQKVMIYSKFFAKSIYNSNYRHEAGRYFSNLHVNAKGSIREIARSILPGVHDHLTSEAEALGLQSSNVDLARNNRVAYAGDSIIKGFNKTLTKDEEQALTLVVMESNAQTLFTTDKNNGKGYSTAQISKLVSDYGVRAKVIDTLKRRIRKSNSARANWLIGQAEGLGIYMAKGTGHVAQNSNSSNIVRGYLTSERHKEDRNLLSLVEELASLTALNHQKPSDQALVGDLLKSEEKGVRNVVNLYKAFVEDSKSTLFKGDASHIIEGYARELFDDKIETTYAVVSKKAEMESLGFKMVSEFESDKNSGAEAIGYFVSDTYIRPEKLSGAIGLGNPNSRGMTLKEARFAQFSDSKKHAQVWFEADKLKYDAEAAAINDQLNDGVALKDIEEGPVPVLDATGAAVDYRNMMPKSNKAKYLNQNRDIIEVLSKTIGSVVDKNAREELNEKVTELIERQIREVYDNPSSKDNQLEYVMVGPNNVDPEIRKLFFQLPTSLQKVANSRADKSLPIPAMLMNVYFGYSQLRATDLPGLKHLPNVAKRIINMIEQVWMDLVKVAKGNVLLKMPGVLVVNIISNMLFAISTGTNPLELVGQYTRSVKDVHKFMQTHKKSEAAKVELASLTQRYNTTKFGSKKDVTAYNDKVMRLRDTIARYDKEMEKSDVKELFDLGMYQAVIEDVNMYKLGETNTVVEKIDGVVGKLPEVVKTPLQWAYLSKETSWYQTNQYILQMSDLVARDVMNRKQKILEKKEADGTRDLPYEYRKLKGMLKGEKRVKLSGAERTEFLNWAENVRHTNLLRYFINYNLPNGKGEEYLNRIGVLMFTKYVKRIQRVISDVSLKHPITGTATLLTAGFGMDLEMIQDSSFMVKAGDDYGLFGLTNIHNPVDVLMTVVNPPLVNLYDTYLGAGYAK